jgi:hypothetical protein
LRQGLAQLVLDRYVIILSRSERGSHVFNAVKKSSELSNRLCALGGIGLVSADVEIHACKIVATEATSAGSAHRSEAPLCAVVEPGKMPEEWLPNGSKSPCNYEIVLKVSVDMEPLLFMQKNRESLINIPGLSSSARLNLCSTSAWENLARDPATTKFYINE